MRYSPTMYAHAFWEVFDPASLNDRRRIIKNLVSTLAKNGDIVNADKVVDAVRSMHVKRNGGRIVRFEFARKVSGAAVKKLSDMFSAKDNIEDRVNPSLIAGVRITIDGERGLDNTIRRKLNRLFGGGTTH